MTRSTQFGKRGIGHDESSIEFQFRACEDVYSSIARLGGQIADSDVLIESTGETDHAQQSLVLSLLHADLAENPNHPTVLYNLGKTHFAEGNFFHAECYLSDCIGGLAHFAESSEQNVPAPLPASAAAPVPLSSVHFLRDAWLKLIDCHRNTGSELWARQAAEQALKHFPNDQQLRDLVSKCNNHMAQP